MTECSRTCADVPQVADGEMRRIEQMLRDMACQLDADAADDVSLKKVEKKEFVAAATVRMHWQLRDKCHQGFGSPRLSSDYRVEDERALQKKIDTFRVSCDLARCGDSLQPPTKISKGTSQREIFLSPVWFWKKQCTSCSGTGQHVCPDCGGNRHTCTVCNGQGRTRCTYCGGTGSQECSSCSGRGYVNCFTCGGRGMTTCSSCGGSGSVPEQYPNTGYSRCYGCGGSGRIFCFTCSGRGDVSCRSCSGRGTVDCQRCGGSGNETCTACNGSGFAICAACSNIGSVSCRECQGKGAAYGTGSVVLLVDTSTDETWKTPPPKNLPHRLQAQRHWILQAAESRAAERQWYYESAIPFLEVSFRLCGKEFMLFMAPGETLSLEQHKDIFTTVSKRTAVRLLQASPEAPPLAPRYGRQARQWKQLLASRSGNERLWTAEEQDAINELDTVTCFWLWARSFLCCLVLTVALVFLMRLAGADAAFWNLAAWPCAGGLRHWLHRRLMEAVPMRPLPEWLDGAGWTFLCLVTLLL